jgi:HEAT repeat protein
MAIEWMAIGGAMLKSAAGAGAGKLAAAAVDQGKRKLFPSDLEKAILAGLEAAQAEDAAASPSSHVFFRCFENEQKECLKRFVEHPTTVDELQKPLEDKGKPDLDCLRMAFEQVGDDLKLDLVKLSVPRWVATFAATYFEQTAAAIQFQVAKGRYLKQLAQRVDDVKFVGIAVPGEEVEKQEVLAQIFVMPDVRKEQQIARQVTFVSDKEPSQLIDLDWDSFEATTHVPSEEEPDIYNAISQSIRRDTLLREQKEWATRDRSSPRVPAQQVLKQTKKKAVLLGAPGSGKTMLVSYFALMLCEQGQCDPISIGFEAGEDWLPVVVRIRDWILQPNMGLLDYLRQYAEDSLCAKALPQGFFEHWLDRGRALILLDGLDEVPKEAQRRKVAEQIETFLHQYRENPAVITSRPAGYRWDFFNLDEFPHYTLEPFDDKQVATFIDHWYDSRLKDDKAKADRRKADLQKAFGKSDRVKMLAKNPLLLTIITLIHRYQAELPRQRHKLYEKAVETLLTSWDSGKEIKLYEVLAYLKQDDLLYVLKKLAYWIHTQGNAGEEDGGTLIDKDELLRQLSQEIKTLKSCKPHEAKQEADRFVDFIQKRTGLLNEQGRDRYAFVHKTFQEYLTAEEIYDRFEEGEDEVILEHIQSHLHDQHWREVLLLLVSRLKKKRAATAIEAILHAGSEYEQWLHRDLLFAGWCLTEDPPELKTAAPKLVGEILDRLIDIEISKSRNIGKKVGKETAEIFHRLGETAIESDAWARLQAQVGKIGRFRVLDFQASLGQEKAVIETLLSLLRDASMRHEVIETLAQLGNSSAEVMTALLSLLKDIINHRDVLLLPSAIIRALIKLGNISADGIDTLLDLLQSDSEWLRYQAALALVKSGNSSPDVVNALYGLLQSDGELQGYQAAVALAQLDNNSANGINILLSSLQDDKASVRYQAAIALAQLGNSSADVVNTLLNLLQEADALLRGKAAAALGLLVNSSANVVNALLRLLQDEQASVRYRAAIALAQLGNNSADVANILLSLLQEDQRSIRYQGKALVQLANSSPDVVNRLLSLLQDKKVFVRFRSALALAQLGNNSAGVMKALLSLLQDDDFDNRHDIVTALGQLGNTSTDVVMALLGSLQDGKPIVRDKAEESLSKLGKKSMNILPALVQWIEQQSDDVPIGHEIDALWSIVVE